MTGAALLVGSTNASLGFEAGMGIPRAGGSAVDAVCAVVALVEANPDDHSVGYVGLPHLLGDVELDASLMGGRTLAAGSVGALRDCQHAIALARRVMEDPPHVLVVAEGTSRLANKTGLPRNDLLTPESERVWRARLNEDGHRTADHERVRELVSALSRVPEHPNDVHGAVNVIAIDRYGHIGCGVGTSGWAWKYPGRLGDSPIVGAGNDADERYGAAACTGRGAMARRLRTAHSVVIATRFGLSPGDALTVAGQDLLALDDPYASDVNIVAIDRDGNHGAISTVPGKTCVFQREEMPSFVERKRRVMTAG